MKLKLPTITRELVDRGGEGESELKACYDPCLIKENLQIDTVNSRCCQKTTSLGMYIIKVRVITRKYK